MRNCLCLCLLYHTFCANFDHLIAQTMQPTPSNGTGGMTAPQLAQMITDASSGISLNASSVSTQVNDPVGGSPASNPVAYGHFVNGAVAPGTPLPTISGGPAATYSGGIGINNGVCLSTGLVTDGTSVPPSRGVGMQGPNNGIPSSTFPIPNHDGEINRLLFAGDVEEPIAVDQDLMNAVFPGTPREGGDSTVLEFTVETALPGIFRIQYVFGSDEEPAWVAEYNDTIAVLIDGENIATLTESSEKKPFSLLDVSLCPQLYKRNNVAPQPTNLSSSLHGAPLAGEPWYDHEFGGFTTVLTRETECVLAAGTHTIKIVVMDVADRQVDSALFVPTAGLKLYSFLQGDFDLDGDVSGLDFLRWQQNYGESNATFTQGDANNDHIVNSSDLPLLFANMGQTGGHKNFCADFDRDGDVDGADLDIWEVGYGIEHCGSRFEGDADGDGDVDGIDFNIWQQETFNGTPAGVCGCAGGAQAMMAGGGGQIALLPEEEQAMASTAEPGDADNDGDFDQADMQYWLTYYGVVQ